MIKGQCREFNIAVAFSTAEMALAWVLKDGIVTSVLIGASKPEQILDNIKAIQNTKFSEEVKDGIPVLIDDKRTVQGI